jgi:hypothetical protein
MSWWETAIFLMVVAVAIWGFISLVGFNTRVFTRKASRTAEDLYPDFADSARKQHRHAREHGDQHRDQGDSSPRSGGTKP